MKEIIKTDAAPAAIGTYSQAVKTGKMVFLSGQLGIDPQTMELVSDDFIEQAEQVFKNLRAVIEAAGASFADVVKLNVYVTNLGDFAELNTVMAKYFVEPYPARAAVEVSALPKGGKVEIEGVVAL